MNNNETKITINHPITLGAALGCLFVSAVALIGIEKKLEDILKRIPEVHQNENKK